MFLLYENMKNFRSLCRSQFPLLIILAQNALMKLLKYIGKKSVITSFFPNKNIKVSVAYYSKEIVPYFSGFTDHYMKSVQIRSFY